MFDKYYSTPLHGVDCRGASQSSTSTPLALKLLRAKVPYPVGLSPIWQLKDSGERYTTELSMFKHADGVLLEVNCEGKGRFFIQPEQIIIDWVEQGTDSSHYFQTVGLAVWLEMKNVPCIHANALNYKHTTFALVAASGTGKTTLSAQLGKSGADLMTDDMMALHSDSANDAFLVHPSWPIARMWPDTIESTLKECPDKFNKVHDRFSKRQVEFSTNYSSDRGNKPLSTIYILNRLAPKKENVGSECRISTVSASKALILLLQHSILGDAYKALGIEKQRVKYLSQLVKSIEIKEVTYSSGQGNLENVSRMILEDSVKH